MNSVLGMTSILMDTILSADQTDYVRTIHTSAESLLAIINDILDFSKIEANKVTLEYSSFNLLVALEEVLDLMAPMIAEKHLEVIFRYAIPADMNFIGDVGRIRQVVVNLVSNAVKFTFSGYIMVDVEIVSQSPTEVELQVTISDTGIGIPKEVVPLLFNRFQQGDSSTTRKFGGN